MDFVFEQIRVGGDRNFAYLLGDRRAGVALAVDPSYAPERVHARAMAQQLDIRMVLNTHGHVDHVNVNDRLTELTGATLGAHASSNLRPDHAFSDGDTFTLGGLVVRVMHVPGHTPDHVVYHLPSWNVAITGDHLFVGKIGGTGTAEEARAEFDSLNRMLDELPDETTIWPGHDYGCRPSSTLALEKATNPFLGFARFEPFLERKLQWAQFKTTHGLV